MDFSIVTPSFRSSNWLKLCIASVADQQGVTHEHIVQDAGSDDGTLSWLEQDERVRAYVEKDEGMYDAINRGLAKARGEICAYLNCDEQYLPGALRKVTEFFRSNPNVDVVFGDMILVNQKGIPISYRRTILPTRRHVRLAHLNTSTCATFFRRRLIEEGFRFDPQWRSIGDAVWMDSLLQARINMAILAEPLAVFTQTGQNLGAGAITQSELRRWRGSKTSRVEQALAVLFHRLSKAVHGAYKKRRVQVQIFTLDSPHERRTTTAEVGFRWISESP